jgi:polysaccharide biosynthesis/export protein
MFKRSVSDGERKGPGKSQGEGTAMRICAMRWMGLGALILAASVLLAGQTASPQNEATSAGDPAHNGKAHDSTFIIGVDDVLAINVWKETELTRTIPVRTDGKVSLPLVGELQAAGRTPLQLEQEITDKLRSYITDPEVSVMVQQINSEKINVLGQVVKPGAYSLSTAPTVMDAIAAANGLKDFAKKKSIYVLRKNASGGEDRFPFNYNDYIKGKNTTQNMKLEPHDTVVVP